MPLIAALRLGTLLGVEVAASHPERLAGVTIFPVREDADRQAEREGWKPSIVDRQFIVRWREYSRHSIEQPWDSTPGNGLGEVQPARVVGEQALEDLLRSWSVPLTALTYLWNTSLPEENPLPGRFTSSFANTL